LLKLIPGPDFPTGGEIIDTHGIREAYLTGRGSIPVRGVANLEEIQTGRGRHRRSAIIISELPYQVNKAGLIEKIAELVNNGKIDGIGDLRDESDRDGIRVVIELRRDANPQKILNFLYRQTPLQNNFGVILLALENAQPRQMSLRQMLQSFLDFRETTLTRQYQHEYDQADNQLHVVEGRLKALANLDEVITILRNAPDGGTAKIQLQESLDLSDRQADAILSMPLRRLTGLERQSLQTEHDELLAKMDDLHKLLSDRKELLKALKKDLRTLKKKYGDERRTKILSATEVAATEVNEKEDAPTTKSVNLAFEFEEEEQDTVVEVTQRGYVRRMAPKTYERLSKTRNDDTVTKELEDGDDFATQTDFTTTGKTLVVFTRNGKAFTLKVRDIPQANNNKAKGSPLVTLLPPAAQAEPDSIAATFILPEDLDDQFVLLLTEQGKIKRLPLSEFADINGRGLTALKLKEGDQLLAVSPVQVGEQVMLATSSGRVLRFEVNDLQVPIASRTSQGQTGMRVGKKERIVGWAIANEDDTFLMISEQGYAKHMEVSVMRRASTGELGTQSFHFNNKTDLVAGIVAVLPQALVFLLTNENHLARIDVDSLELRAKDERGDRVVKLSKTERITHVSLPVLFGSEEDE
jgi:DNA gyrase subunit A